MVATKVAKVSKVEEPEASAKDYKIPAVMVGVAIAIYLVISAVTSGMAGVKGTLEALPVIIGVKVVMGVTACLLTAKIMGAAFGYLGSAILKLAAIFVFPGAVTFFIPGVIGWIVSLILYWGLIEWLFELDPMETIVLSIVIWMVNAVALMLIVAIGVATH